MSSDEPLLKSLLKLGLKLAIVYILSLFKLYPYVVHACEYVLVLPGEIVLSVLCIILIVWRYVLFSISL